jgi:hypothetical protein
MAICSAVDPTLRGATHGCARQPHLVVVHGRPVWLLVLLKHPLPGDDCIRILEAHLEDLGASKGEILYLARMPRQMLDE